MPLPTSTQFSLRGAHLVNRLGVIQRSQFTRFSPGAELPAEETSPKQTALIIKTVKMLNIALSHPNTFVDVPVKAK